MSDESLWITCAFFGFDLESFDKWLDGLPDCGARKELTQRRQKVIEALERRTDEDGRTRFNLEDSDDIKRHLEWMMIRRREIETANAAAPLARQAKRQSDTQREKANKRWADQKEITELVTRLANNPEHRDLYPNELWPHFYATLEDQMLDPVEVGRGSDKAYQYNGGKTTYEAFRKQVRRARD